MHMYAFYVCYGYITAEAWDTQTVVARRRRQSSVHCAQSARLAVHVVLVLVVLDVGVCIL